MAMLNPMQKKARISFLLGILITLLITGVVIVLLFLYTDKLKKQIQTYDDSLTSIYVLTQDVKSGEEVTEDMFQLVKVDKNTIPSDATKTSAVIESWYMRTKDGTPLNRDGEGLYYIETTATGTENKIRVLKEDITDNYYIVSIQNGKETKQYIELDSVPVIAKLDMKKNTIITPNLVEQSDNVITNDVRVEDYNVVILPVDLTDGDYVDIRLMAPNGQNFIVVSKKLVEIPENGDGSKVADIIRLSLREDEILAMSSAIVEAAGISGAKLYATRYKEAGMQDAAVPTYRPNDSVTALIGIDSAGNVTNPNIVAQAVEELRMRYTSPASTARKNYIEPIINDSIDYDSQVQEGLNESNTKAQEARKEYIDSLSQD